MRMRVTLAALAVVGAALAPQASAKASAGVFHEMSATFSFTSPAATFDVTVVARVNDVGISAQHAQVAVTVTRCAGKHCDVPVTLASAAPTGAVTIAPDFTTGTLSVQLFGRPLAISWDELQAGPLPASHLDTTQRSSVQAYRVVSAHGTVAGRSCRTDQGTVSVGVAADTGDAALPSTLPAKAPTRLRPLLTATCGYAREFDG